MKVAIKDFYNGKVSILGFICGEEPEEQKVDEVVEEVIDEDTPPIIYKESKKVRLVIILEK